jgi:hypothetical protein
MKPAVLLALSAVFVTGCATTVPDTVSIPDRPVKVNIPEWFSVLPKAEGSIFSSGTAVSPDLQLSQDMAILNAKVNLADRINSRVQSQTKSYSSQVGTESKSVARQELEKATKNTVADVDVAGYNVVKSQTVQQGYTYRTFVLLEYSETESLNIVMNRNRRTGSLNQPDKAFEELEKEVNKIKQ